jgi:hypothetical protein
MDSPQVSTTKEKRHNEITIKKIAYIAACIVAVGMGYGAHYLQSGTSRNAQSEVLSLKAEKDSLVKDKTALEEKNKNLSTSISLLQKQFTPQEGTQSTVSDSDEPEKPTVGLAISEVKNLPGTDFGVTGYTPPRGDFKVVYTTISNLADVDQKFDIFQFDAITKGGVVIKPMGFSPLETQGLWNNSVLAPTGKKDIVLLFPVDSEIVILRHAPSSVSVAVPTM